MFALSHTYISTNVVGRKDKLLVIGSVISDLRVSFLDGSANALHDKPEEFEKFVKANYPNLADLALGIKLHSAVDGGADFYSDDYDTGFAVIEGLVLREGIKKLLRRNDLKYKVLEHNFIEAALDLNLVEYRPEMADMYTQALDCMDEDQISMCVGEFLGEDISKVKEEIEHFFKVFNIMNLADEQRFSREIIVPLMKRRYGLSVDEEEVRRLLAKARAQIKDSYVSFFEETIFEMKKTFGYF